MALVKLRNRLQDTNRNLIRLYDVKFKDHHPMDYRQKKHSLRWNLHAFEYRLFRQPRNKVNCVSFRYNMKPLKADILYYFGRDEMNLRAAMDFLLADKQAFLDGMVNNFLITWNKTLGRTTAKGVRTIFCVDCSPPDNNKERFSAFGLDFEFCKISLSSTLEDNVLKFNVEFKAKLVDGLAVDFLDDDDNIVPYPDFEVVFDFHVAQDDNDDAFAFSRFASLIKFASENLENDYCSFEARVKPWDLTVAQGAGKIFLAKGGFVETKNFV